MRFEVVGRPATFATAREAAWKAEVDAAAVEAMADPEVRPPRSGSRFALRVEFRTPVPTQPGEAWDIDNLVKPTMDALGAVIGVRPWAGPKQVADDTVDRLEASKRTIGPDESTGATVEVLADDGPDPTDPS